MRFSDIFKRIPSSTPPLPEAPPSASGPLAVPAQTPTPSKEPPASPSAHLEVAQQALEVVRRVKQAILQEQPIPLPELKQSAEELVGAVIQSPASFVEFALTPSQEDFSLLHSIHTGILTVILGNGARYTTDRLNQVTLAALLHDVGMLKVLSLITQPRKLTLSELQEVRKYPLYTGELLESMPDLPRMVAVVGTQANERVDGTGYPAGLSDGAIIEEARLVGLASVFESLTHPRPYRIGLTALNALKLITGDLRGSFDPQFVKLLIEHVGFYPKGSWVELSRGEQGRVVEFHPGFPLRPVVEVIRDLYGQPYPQPKRIDLKNQPTLYITKDFGMAPPTKGS